MPRQREAAAGAQSITPATILEHDGVKQPVTEWALDYGITPAIIIGRLERGETIAAAITKPMQVGHRGQKLANADMEKFIARNTARWNRERRGGLGREKITKSCGPKPKTYTLDGKTLSIPEWSMLTGLKIATIRGRLYKGWDIASVLCLPPNRHGNRKWVPGVVSNLPASTGTGAGSVSQAMAPNITFSGIEA